MVLLDTRRVLELEDITVKVLLIMLPNSPKPSRIQLLDMEKIILKAQLNDITVIFDFI